MKHKNIVKFVLTTAASVGIVGVLYTVNTTNANDSKSIDTTTQISVPAIEALDSVEGSVALPGYTTQATGIIVADQNKDGTKDGTNDVYLTARDIHNIANAVNHLYGQYRTTAGVKLGE